MAKKVIPVYQLGENCDVDLAGNFEIAPFTDRSCTVAEFGVHHRHEYYEIIWLRKGKGIHHIDTTSYPYDGAVLFLLSPGQIHLLQQEDISEGYVIRFLPSVFRDPKDVDDFVLNSFLFDNVQAYPLISVPNHLHDVFDDLFLKMNNEFLGKEADNLSVVSAYLKILMTHIIRVKSAQQNNQQPMADVQYSLFAQYKTAIEKKFNKEHSVQAYAQQLHTQPRTLNSVTRKYTGKSAGELITDRILLEARRSLLHNIESVKEIAFGLGFRDPAYFTRFFKKHIGISPQEYKQRQFGSSTNFART